MGREVVKVEELRRAGKAGEGENANILWVRADRWEVEWVVSKGM